MTRYFFVIVAVNAFCFALFKNKSENLGLSKKAFTLILSFSTMLGIVFPIFKNIFGIKFSFGINFFITLVSACFIYLNDKSNVADVEKVENDIEKDILAGRSEASVSSREEVHKFESIKLESDSIDEMNSLLNTYIEKGFEAKIAARFEEAINFFIKALKLKPPLELASMLYFDISGMLKEIGQYSNAKRYLSEFVEMNKNNLTKEVLREAEVNIQYFEFLIEALQKANMEDVPFAMLPDLIKMIVTEKVHQWEKENL